MTGLRIRPEEPADSDPIRDLHVASFPGPAEARLVDALREAGRLAVSLVADVEIPRHPRHAIIGHVAFSPVTIAGELPGSGVGLAPVAVSAAFRRRGVAERLVREGLDRCRAAGLGFVVVLGEPRYYGRFGFVPARLMGLADEYGGGAAFQALELEPGAIPTAGGLVRYAAEFAGLEAE